MACGLIEAGLKPGEHVILMAANRPEWLYRDFAIMAAGGVTVPISPSLLPKVAAFIAEDTQSRFAIAGAPEVVKLAGHRYPERIFDIDEDVSLWTDRRPALELLAKFRHDREPPALRKRSRFTV